MSRKPATRLKRRKTHPRRSHQLQNPLPLPNPESQYSNDSKIGSTPLLSSSSDEAEARLEEFEAAAAVVPEQIGDDQPTAPVAEQLPEPEIQLPGPMRDETSITYLVMGTDYLAKFFKDDRLKLDNSDQKEIGPYWRPVLEKYMKRINAVPFLALFAEEIQFCLVMFGIYGPRYLMSSSKTSSDGTGTSA